MKFPYNKFLRNCQIKTEDDLKKLNDYLIDILLPPISLDDIYGKPIQRPTRLDNIIHFFEIPQIRIRINCVLLQSWVQKQSIDDAWKLIEKTSFFSKQQEFNFYARYFFDLRHFNRIDLEKFIVCLSQSIAYEEANIYRQCLEDPNAILSKLGFTTNLPQAEDWTAIFWQVREKILNILNESGEISRQAAAVSKLGLLLETAYDKLTQTQSANLPDKFTLEGVLDKIDDIQTEKHNQDLTIDDIIKEL